MNKNPNIDRVQPTNLFINSNISIARAIRIFSMNGFFFRSECSTDTIATPAKSKEKDYRGISAKNKRKKTVKQPRNEQRDPVIEPSPAFLVSQVQMTYRLLEL